MHATPVNPGGPGDGNPGTAGNSAGSPLSWQGNVGGVNTATGNKMTSVPLVSWTARGGLPVSFSLTHNSEATYSNFNGQKWTYSYLDFVVDEGGGTILVYLDDGSVYTYMQVGNSNVYAKPAGVHDTLVRTLVQNGVENFTLTTKDQVVYNFTHGLSLSGTPYAFLTSISDENGNAISITYTASTSFNVYQIIDPTGRKITLAYDSYNRLTTVTDPLNRVWTLGYVANPGNFPSTLLSVTFPAVNGASPKMQFTYGNHILGGIHYDQYDIVGIQDLNGNSSSYTYTTDGLGSIATETDAKGITTTFSYGTTATTITDANSHATVHTYNTSGQLTSVTDAYGFQDSYTYDADNNVLTHKDRNANSNAGGGTWTYTYDTGNSDSSAHGNRLSSLDPRNAAAHLPATQYTYTPHNRLASVTRPSAIRVTLNYDGLDNLTSIVESYGNANGTYTTAATTTIAYPQSPSPNYGLPVSKTDNNGHKTQYQFDGNGNLTQVATPKGNTTKWVYEALGFRTQRTDAMNRITNYTPDGWERLVTTTYPDSSTHTFGYDNNSNLTAFTDAAIGVTRIYDVDNRMTSESYNGSVELQHTYDATGQKGLLSTSVYAGQTVTYTYTPRNELYQVTDAVGTSTYGYTSGGQSYYGYDADGNQDQQTLANGARVGKVFDADSSLTEVNNLLPSGTTASQFLYAYDLDGRKTTGSDSTGASLSWGYDGQSHLNTDARAGGYAPYHDGYALDSVGNRTSTSNVYGTFNYGYDADDELTTYNNSGYTFGYNANGDMTSGTLSGNLSTLAYDYDDQLTSITSTKGTVSYLYDALGRRIYRQDATGLGHTFLFDGSRVVAEDNGTTNSFDAIYTWGYDLLDKQGTGGTELPLYDGQGDTYQTLTASGSYVLSGDITNDFGQAFTAASGTDDQSYQWRASSGYRMEGDGLWAGNATLVVVQVGARYYMPAMGVFLTRDTDLAERPYQYCNADPVNSVDPSGHAPGDGLMNLSQYIPSSDSNSGDASDTTVTSSSQSPTSPPPSNPSSTNAGVPSLPSAGYYLSPGFPKTLGSLLASGNYGVTPEGGFEKVVVTGDPFSLGGGWTVSLVGGSSYIFVGPGAGTASYGVGVTVSFTPGKPTGH